MKSVWIAAASLFGFAIAGVAPVPNKSSGTPGPDKDGKYTISAEGLRLQFIPYGAALTNLFIKDKQGIERDIVLGYDNATAYETDPSHPFLGSVPGRYANRIKNSTFTLDGVRYNILPNEHDGRNTLHGGPNGWDHRNFTVVAHDSSSIVFKFVDPDGEQGFPGEVTSYIEYWVSPYKWHISMNATATKKTPIMLTSHVYWNLDAFQNPNSDTILDHEFSLPFGGQRVDVDGNLIPTGTILANEPGSPNDFWSKPKKIGTDINNPALVGNCGTGCTGYDNCYLTNRGQLGADYTCQGNHKKEWWKQDPVASLSSAFTGIKIDVFSDQDAFQIYTCSGQNGTQPIKRTQGFFDNAAKPRVTQKYGCIVMEVQDWIDGINNPAWQRGPKQVIGPNTEPYLLEATYAFSVK